MIELEPGWADIVPMALALASVHIWFSWFDKRFASFETQWVGFIGGIALGYVTLYMLPKIGVITEHLSQAAPDGYELIQMQAYLMLLAGITLYLLNNRLDNMAHRYSRLARIFDLTVHGLYSFLIGYIVVELPRRGVMIHILATAIFMMHLMGMNHILRRTRASAYDRYGRWFFALLVLTGSALAIFTELPKVVINTLTAFLAGIILVNVMLEELPKAYSGRLRWFVAGVFCMVAVLAAILSVPAIDL